jgi:membrane protein required for colicin V production
LIGIIAAVKFGPDMANLLESLFSSDYALVFLAGTLLTFVLTMILIRFLARGLENILESANINIINQALGGFVVASLFIALYSVLVLFADRSRLISEETKQNSLTYELLVPFPGKILSAGRRLQPTFEEFWDHSLDFIDRMDQDVSVERQETDQVYDIEDPNNTDYSPQKRPVRNTDE